MIRASDGFHVWSQVYDRTLDDIFEIQDEIAGEVGSALSQSLLGTEGETLFAGIATTDADAYDLYLSGPQGTRHLLVRRTRRPPRTCSRARC